MKSKAVSRRAFLGGGAALGLSAYTTKAGYPLQAAGFIKPDTTPMKITKIETIPLSLPVKPFADGADKTGGKSVPKKYVRPAPSNQAPPSKATARRDETGNKLMDYVLVKIHTDKGIVGIGDAPTDSVETLETVKFMIDRHMAPNLIGRNPLDIERNNDIINVMKNGRFVDNHATAAINYALYDIMGKALNVPVSTLLGGLYRTKVLAAIEVPRGTPEEMAAHSLEYYKQGIRGIKAKVGSDPDRDAKCLKSIREALGDKISLRADANQGYSIQEAIRLCKLAKDYDVGLELLEQPTSSTDFDGTRRITQATDIPIEMDESADSLYQVFQILKNDTCDLINTKCSKAGGISGVKKWAAVAESARKTIVIGTEYGLGSVVAAKVILGCTIKNADPVVEFTEIMLHDILLKNPLELKDGYIDVPTAPGIGWEFDEAKIEKYRVRDFPK